MKHYNGGGLVQGSKTGTGGCDNDPAGLLHAGQLPRLHHEKV